MKPAGPSTAGKRQFPRIDYFFHSGLGEWRGQWPSSDGDDESESRKFNNLSREFLMESARERVREMIVFGFLVVVSAWPVIYMAVIVGKLLWTGRPIPH